MVKVRKNLLFVFILIFLGAIILNISNVSALNCWTHLTNATCLGETGCNWRSDTWGNWCEELNCWSLTSQSQCTTTNVPGKNCTWQGGGTTYGCEKLSCWSLSGTSANSCANNTAGLSCEWQNSCYLSGMGGSASLNCWNQQNQSACLNATGCSWGNCMEKGCWSYITNTTCNAARDWNGKNCTWENSYCTQNGCWKYYNQSDCGNTAITKGLSCEWKWNSCQDIDCYSWDFTNQTACVNNTANLSCSWSGSYCSKQDCWSYNTQTNCQNKPGCLWKAYVSSGWCNEVNCWSWDSWNGGTKTTCEANGVNYGLNCIWSGNPTGDETNGCCYKNIATTSCANKTTERECMDTFYCWWQYYNWTNTSAGGTCNAPGSFAAITTNNTIFNDWSPGCYIFDMNSSDCNNIVGCNYTGGLCQLIADSVNNATIINTGINCTMVNDSSLCNNIPVLSYCCAWQNGSCLDNKLSSACKDQLQQKTEDSCEDADTQARCNQIAGSPWYMPCNWQNSTSKCLFKSEDIFGANSSQSIMLINNKMSCEAAGGKWIVENYCEGNVSIPTGRCEYKFNEEDNCDKACFACENKDSDGTTVNSTNAETACLESKLGFCQYYANANAPNGIGYCKAKEQFKKGIAGDCETNCGDCTFKGNSNSTDNTKKPSYYCGSSKANADGGGCKWITDNSTLTGGYCVKKGEKICEDTCDRCATQSNCANLGRTAGNLTAGGCRWDGSGTTGSCVMNTDADAEICWDGIDNNNNSLIDCGDAGCYSDSFCGLVSGDCFGWPTNATCIEHNSSCEWVTDNWGEWCDFKGSQCWKYNVNSTNCAGQTNCKWTNGTGSGMCENDWSKGDVCMGLSYSACNAANASSCNWTVDAWCSGTGNGTDWCASNGGWCDYNEFKPKNCWAYSSSNSSACNAVSGCSWKTNSYSQPHCEVDWGANCWNYMNATSCNATSNCIWDIPPQGGGWCMNKADKCWSYTQANCISESGGRCYWQSWGGGGTTGGSCQSACYNGSINPQANCATALGCIWKEENGWCEESGGCWNLDSIGCTNATGIASGCRWKDSGYCDPKEGGFSSATGASGGGMAGGMGGGDCFKYDGNQTLCTNKTIINISCGWTANTNPTCDVNWNANCWEYTSIAGGCTSDNGCWFKNDSWSAYCTNVMDQCWSNESYQMWSNPSGWADNCSANVLCINNSWGSCEPRCSSKTNSTDCTADALAGKCRWTTGWCNPGIMNEMFTGMQAGASAPIGADTCPESTPIQASVDICGFGMKDMGDSYGFGAGVSDFSNASVCNKEKLSSFVMGMAGTPGGGGGGGSGMGVGGIGTTFGTERTGTGNETIIYIIYLDSDGLTTGGCTLDSFNSSNSSAAGYEFRFKYISQWSSTLSKAVETFNADKCEGSAWKATDIKLSSWKKKMCSDMGGPMIAVKKDDLTRFPTLYDSTKDLRIFVATIGDNRNNVVYNITSPTDTAGAGWTTPGSIDFEIKSAFDYGADSAKFEDILKGGFVLGEDCFNTIDDNNDGKIDCADWGCQYSSKCLTYNYTNGSDTSSPLVTGVKIEEYLDAALIMYDTSKPTNGTLELYNYGDTQCLNKTYNIYDIGILSPNVPDYKLWHTAVIYDANNTNISLNWPLANSSTYNYKLRVCDSNGKCAVSKCSSFSTAVSEQKCGYCNFVARIKTPTGWSVAYDVDRNGVYEYTQGQVCGPNAGMKMNYTAGRKVNVKLYKDDGTMYIEFLNASLTKTALNDKVRTISTLGDIINSSTFVGLTSETRDKIVNNLHPEVCRVKIPVASGATCDTLYHCDDSGLNCVNRTGAAGGAPINATACIWTAPNCEFSTYKTSAAPGGGTPSGGGGGGGGSGGGTSGSTYMVSDAEFTTGYTNNLAKNDQFKFSVSGIFYYVKVSGLTSNLVSLNVSGGNSAVQKVTLTTGETKNFEVSGDGTYDVSVKVNSVNMATNKTSLTIKSFSEKAASEEEKAPVTGEVVGEETGQEISGGGEKPGINTGTLIWILGGIILIAAVIFVLLRVLKKK